MRKKSANRSKSPVSQEKVASEPKSQKSKSSKKVSDASESSSDSDFVKRSNKVSIVKAVEVGNSNKVTSSKSKKRMAETFTEDVSHKSKKRRTEDISKVGVKGGKNKKSKNSPKKTSGMWDGTLTLEKAFEIFESNVEVVLRGNPEFLDMKNFETGFFFPILAFEHYYLVIFNLARAAFTIIDNSASCDEYDVKYKQVCDVVRDLFVCHLRKYGHPKADSIKKVKHNIMKMKWRTKKNKSDCGVFLMCHMDTYVGQAREDWDIGFKSERASGDVTQKIQLTNLRAKYCTKILCYSKNILKHNFDGYLKALKENYHVPTGKEAIRKAVASNMHFDRL